MNIRRAWQRGYSKNSWLESYFSFSFAGYYDHDNIQFGTLRVINDDKIEPMSGFPLHPHSNMEIITIVISGKLVHIDSIGNKDILDSNKIQYMSAGSGIMHSEFNASSTQELRLFQIWIKPDKLDCEPKYQTITISPEDYRNKLLNIVGSKNNESISIRQDTLIYRGCFDIDECIEVEHSNSNTSWYIFIIDGEAEINGEKLSARDSAAIISTDKLNGSITKKCDLLIFDVAMK